MTPIFFLIFTSNFRKDNCWVAPLLALAETLRKNLAMSILSLLTKNCILQPLL